MKAYLILLILMSTSALFAQTEFLDTLTTANTPFQIPIRIGTSGELSFLETPDNFMVGPAFGGAYSKSVVQYISPIKLTDPTSLLSPITEERSWMEVRRRRYDGGLGLVALMGNNFYVGLVPFKGAMQTTVRIKDSKEAILPDDLRIPQTLDIISNWRTGDQGTYQMYGGVEILAAFGVSFVNLARSSVAFQNQFIVEVRKVSDKLVLFSIAEEDLKRSESSIGPLVSKVALDLFYGKRFRSEFVLDLTNPMHHDLYKQGLAGKIIELQTKLDHRSQKLKWIGAKSSFYIGIPYFIGVEKSQGSYSINTDGQDSDMSIKTRFNKGIFATQGEHDRLVYRTEDLVLLLWNSQMKKAHHNVMEKYFFRFGRSIGIQGFGESFPRGLYGSVQTQIGLAFSREEIESFRALDVASINNELRLRCEALKLNCRRLSKRQSMLKNLTKAMKAPWNEMSFELGKLLMKHPALIQSVLKISKLKKEVYIKFLNDNYQSTEGMLEVGL